MNMAAKQINNSERYLYLFLRLDTPGLIPYGMQELLPGRCRGSDDAIRQAKLKPVSEYRPRLQKSSQVLSIPVAVHSPFKHCTLHKNMKIASISRAVFIQLLLFIGITTSFVPLPIVTVRTHRQCCRYNNALSLLLSSLSDDDFMASLKSRVQEVSDRETKLPLVVLDSMLPRQVLKIAVNNNPVFLELIRQRVADETPFFGMLGLARLASGEQVHLRSGVQVDIVGKPLVVDTKNANTDGKASLQIELKAVRRFRIVGEVDDAPSGWTEARVEFLSDKDNESDLAQQSDRLGLARAMSKARRLRSLVDEWIVLARTKERHSGQIDRLLLELGDMPSSEEPTDRAFWVGALINPIPSMGVALEIRPALLTARTAEERVDIALSGIQRSIQHMLGEPLLS